MTDTQAHYLDRMITEGNVRVPRLTRDALERQGLVQITPDGLCQITLAGELALQEQVDCPWRRMCRTHRR